MIELVIIADDFTGALDTGVQFSKKGVRTLVTTHLIPDFSAVPDDVSVLSVDIESRHLSPAEAAHRVQALVRAAKDADVRRFYKKTDSTLRGNIGGELSALLTASGEQSLFFIPAFPRIGRATKDGIHYVNGVPVSETVFAKDPFEPVRFSRIADILAEQTDLSACTVTLPGLGSFAPDLSGQTIYVFDGETDTDLEQIGKRLLAMDGLSVVGGCAGFADQLPALLGLPVFPARKTDACRRILLVSGSVNQISLDQLSHAEANGAATFTMQPEQKLRQDYLDTYAGTAFISQLADTLETDGLCLVRAVGSREDMDAADHYAEKHGLSPESLSIRISAAMGRIVLALLSRDALDGLIVFGGDTLLGIMDLLGCRELYPAAELVPGIAQSALFFNGKEIPIATKAGGFGEKEVVFKLDAAFRA